MTSSPLGGGMVSANFESPLDSGVRERCNVKKRAPGPTLALAGFTPSGESLLSIAGTF